MRGANGKQNSVLKNDIVHFRHARSLFVFQVIAFEAVLLDPSHTVSHMLFFAARSTVASCLSGWACQDVEPSGDVEAGRVRPGGGRHSD